MNRSIFSFLKSFQRNVQLWDAQTFFIYYICQCVCTVTMLLYVAANIDTISLANVIKASKQAK